MLEAWIAAAALAATGAAGGMTFGVDARVSLVVADDDFATSADESGSAVFGTPATRLFYEDYESIDLAYDRDPFIALSAVATPGDWTAEAVLAPRLTTRDPPPGDTAPEPDWGSYLRLARDTAAGRVGVVAYPASSDRLRIGYRAAASYSGSSGHDVSATDSHRWTPALEVTLDGERAYALAAVKGATSTGNHPGLRWGALGGAGLELGPLPSMPAPATSPSAALRIPWLAPTDLRGGPPRPRSRSPSPATRARRDRPTRSPRDRARFAATACWTRPRPRAGW